MEEVDKGCLMTRMGVSGWMFLLVPAYPVVPDIGTLNGCVYVCTCWWADSQSVTASPDLEPEGLYRLCKKLDEAELFARSKPLKKSRKSSRKLSVVSECFSLSLSACLCNGPVEILWCSFIFLFESLISRHFQLQFTFLVVSAYNQRSQPSLASLSGC